MQTVVSFGEFILLNAARLWANSPFDQKQRLQQVIFPQGVEFEGGTYRTRETSLVFFDLDETGTKRMFW